MFTVVTTIAYLLEKVVDQVLTRLVAIYTVLMDWSVVVVGGLNWGERIESLSSAVMNVEIVCHGPTRYLFFVLMTLYQLSRESCAWAQELSTMKAQTRHRNS